MKDLAKLFILAFLAYSTPLWASGFPHAELNGLVLHPHPNFLSAECVKNEAPLPISLTAFGSFSNYTRATQLFHELKNHPEMTCEVPENGCFDRAFLICYEINKLGLPCSILQSSVDRTVPVKTIWLPKTNSRGWIRHFAPVVTLPNGKRPGFLDSTIQFVIDPVLFDGPVSVDTWLEQVSPGKRYFTLEKWRADLPGFNVPYIRDQIANYFLPEKNRRKELHAKVQSFFKGYTTTVESEQIFRKILSEDHDYRISPPTQSRWYNAFLDDSIWNELRGFLNSLSSVTQAEPKARQMVLALINGLDSPQLKVRLLASLALGPLLSTERTSQQMLNEVGHKLRNLIRHEDSLDANEVYLQTLDMIKQ